MPKIIRFVSRNNVPVYDTMPKKPDKKPSNTLMLGTYMEILNQDDPMYYLALIYKKEYWILKSDTTEINEVLKLYFVDVGQGDGMLLEVGDFRMIIDGGKGRSLKGFMDKWKYKYLKEDGKTIDIDCLFITHLDEDHFKGFIDILNDPLYHIKNVYFAGLIKFTVDKKTTLGTMTEIGHEKFVTTYFEDIESIANATNVSDLIMKFYNAYVASKSRFADLSSERLDVFTGILIDKEINNIPFKLEVLGPVPNKLGSQIGFKWFDDASVTINGHSLVLKMTYGERTVLFGGDLNEYFENHIMDYYNFQPNNNPFSAEVFKAGHHGSRDFNLSFLQKVNPVATIFSSGDNESYDHPSALALGCAGKYSRSSSPLVFSTELARSYSKEKIIFGMIFYRSNGQEAYFTQMKEAKGKGNPFAVYEVK